MEAEKSDGGALKQSGDVLESQELSSETNVLETKDVSISDIEEKDAASNNIINEVANMDSTVNSENTFDVPPDVPGPRKRGRKKKIKLYELSPEANQMETKDVPISDIQEDAESNNEINDDASIELSVNSENTSIALDAVPEPRKRGRKKKIKKIRELSSEADPIEMKDVSISDIQDKDAESSNGINEDVSMDSTVNSENTSDTPTDVLKPRKRGRKKKIYNDDDDADTIKEKRKKRAMELKLRNLKCTFNATEVSGKRIKKAPIRFELQPVEKRKSTVDDGIGRGEYLGDIRWINHQLKAAKLHTLRLLHRVIYRKQGMFAEKGIIKNITKFNGFPFKATHPELVRRKEHLQRMNMNDLKQISDLLGLRPGSHDEMVERIIEFLLCPTQKQIETYVMGSVTQGVHEMVSREVMESKLQHSKTLQKPFDNSYNKPPTVHYMPVTYEEDDHLPIFSTPLSKVDLSIAWKKPSFFMEGNGVKLKYIRAVIANIEAASEAFVELLHRLLYLNVDEKSNMRRNILEFSGLNCDIATPNYVYRVRILSVLPMEQLKLICRVLCLPTWHRSRPFLTDAIMDFLSVPRVSAMKKRVPPVFSDEISFSFDNAKGNHAKLPGLKSDEFEEIEIIPDIHIPDEDSSSHIESECHENEYVGVKLKNFSNIHYQVISTPAAKLTDVHMILYLTTSAQNNIRKNILEFSGFAFEENTSEYVCRRTLMEQMNLEDLKTVATVLCVSQYICDDSKTSLIDAILKFLLKPSALLSSSTIMPTISQAPVIKSTPVVKKKATSTSAFIKRPSMVDIKPEIVISTVGTLGDSKNTSMKAIIDAMSHVSSGRQKSDKIEIEKVKACLSNSAIQITAVPLFTDEKEFASATPVQQTKAVIPKAIKMEVSEAVISPKGDEPLLNVKSEVLPSVQYFGSDDDDDLPLSKMIGHPNDDQLKALVSKIIKESRLEDVTMKHVIRKVFEAYPNYDLNYRKEFIKSNVRLILSQMDDQNCSVSTTVINI